MVRVAGSLYCLPTHDTLTPSAKPASCLTVYFMDHSRVSSCPLYARKACSGGEIVSLPSTPSCLHFSYQQTKLPLSKVGAAVFFQLYGSNRLWHYNPRGREKPSGRLERRAARLRFKDLDSRNAVTAVAQIGIP